MAFVEGFSLKKGVFPFSRGKNCISQGVENRGSLISVPLALRVAMHATSAICIAIVYAAAMWWT